MTNELTSVQASEERSHLDWLDGWGIEYEFEDEYDVVAALPRSDLLSKKIRLQSGGVLFLIVERSSGEPYFGDTRRISVKDKAMQSAKTYRYRVVDVFTEVALEGNPLAIFPDARGLSETLMQRIAKELNLSETAFVLPSNHADCVARAQIFTPAREVPFAGHPTVGTSYVLIEEGVALNDRFWLEEKIGKVPIRVERGQRSLIWLETPPIKEGNQVDRNLCAQSLGLAPNDLLDIPPQIVSAGNPFLYVALKDTATVDRAYLSSLGALRAESDDPLGVFVFAPVPQGVYSRMFAPEHGVTEDPATGSATGPLAAYMIKHGLISGKPGTRFVSEQGVRMGRRSILHVLITDEGIEVGGYVTPLAEATMSLT